MPALASLKSFASSRNGKLALGGAAAAAAVGAGLMSRRRSGGDASPLVPYSEVQGTSGVNSGAFPSLEATGVTAGELEAVYNQVGALADKVDALTEAKRSTATRTPVPMPILTPRTTPPPSPTKRKSAAPTYPKGLPATTRYTVRSGDTLSAIAKRFRLPGGYRDLLVWNPSIKDPNKIQSGQVLVVPKV